MPHQLLAATALTLSGMLPLPLPIPGLPTTEPTTEPTPAAQQVVVSGILDAPDGRLKKGCKDYTYAYSVSSESEDWTFDITMQDRTGKGVNSQSLIGPNDPQVGTLSFRLCRWSAKPGRYTLTGRLTAYEGYSTETTVPVTETFKLRKTKNRR